MNEYEVEDVQRRPGENAPDYQLFTICARGTDHRARTRDHRFDVRARNFVMRPSASAIQEPHGRARRNPARTPGRSPRATQTIHAQTRSKLSVSRARLPPVGRGATIGLGPDGPYVAKAIAGSSYLPARKQS